MNWFWKRISHILINFGDKKIRHNLPYSLTIKELRDILQKRNYNDQHVLSILDEENILQLNAKENRNKSSEKNNSNDHSIKLTLENQKNTANENDLNRWRNIVQNCNLLSGIGMYRKTPEYAKKEFLKFRTTNENPFHSFRIKDDSYKSEHNTQNQLRGSFISNQIFDLGLESSDTSIDPAFFSQQIQRHSTRVNAQTKYWTFSWNFPRVEIKFNSSFLEPTPDFVQSIDEILSIEHFQEQYLKLDQLFSTYGHIYPHRVTLGGSLYHTEHYSNQNQSEQQEQLRNTRAVLSTILLSSNIQMNRKNEDQSPCQSSSKKNCSIYFQAIGGDTLMTHDLSHWISTIADHNLWRPIKQDDCQWITSVLDQEKRDKLKPIIDYYHKRKKFGSSYSKWKKLSTRILRTNQVSSPYSICIDDNQTIYVTDLSNHCVLQWKLNERNCQIVAGGHQYGGQTHQLAYPSKVIFDKSINSLIIADRDNRRVVRWSLENETRRGHIFIENIDCHGLAIDKDGSLYVADCKNNEVKRWKQGETDGTIVAGGNGQGTDLNQLNAPSHLFIDEEYSLYISDSSNHRIIKWCKNATQGSIVAGGNGAGSSLKQLYYPQGLILDPLGHIYVADLFNHRIICWGRGDREGRTIVGGYEQGNQSNQLSYPTDLTFDLQGNLYVADKGNHRIQQFQCDTS